MRRILVADLYLLAFFIGAIAFAAWEGVAVLPRTPTHTISYFAHQYVWFRVLIAVVLPAIFGAWFWAHSSAPIPK